MKNAEYYKVFLKHSPSLNLPKRLNRFVFKSCIHFLFLFRQIVNVRKNSRKSTDKMLKTASNSTLLFQCVPIPGLGFRRGSYRCVCRRGFYFPNTTAENRYYNGSDIEEEYEKHLSVRLFELFIKHTLKYRRYMNEK